MIKYFRLLRVGLRVNFGLSFLRPKYLLTKKKDLWLLPLILLGLAGLAPILLYYLKGIRWMYSLLVPLGQQAALLTFALMMGQFLILVFGFYYVLSAFYFSRDLELLVPLPVTPAQVLLSKFSVVVVNEYLTAALLVIPMLVMYGIEAQAGVSYWLTAVFVYLLLPVIPLALVALLVVGLMRFVNLGRKKDALIIVGSLVLIAASLGFQLLINRSIGSTPDEKVLLQFFAEGGFVQRIGSKFPPSIWATRALAPDANSSGFLSFLFYAGVSAFLFGLLFLAARAFFYRGLVGLGEITAKKRRLSRERLSAGMSSGPRPIRAVFLREIRIMNRTPIFLLNGVLSVVLIPVVFILMAKTGGRGGDSLQILKLLGSSNPAGQILGTALFMTICGCLNGTAPSTFSREGSQFWMSKIIPVSPADQVKGKFLHSFAIAGLGLVAAGTAAVLVLGSKIEGVLIALPVAAAASAVLTALGMFIDLARPLLTWTNPQKAIKQNFNVLIAFFADAGILIGLTIAGIAVLKKGLRPGLVIGGVLVLLLALTVLSFKLLLRFAERRYGEIET